MGETFGSSIGLRSSVAGEQTVRWVVAVVEQTPLPVLSTFASARLASADSLGMLTLFPSPER